MRNCPRINEIDGKFLEAPFEAEEILESIKACAGDKAPGPDGYTMAFFSQCWDIIRHELVAAVQNFHARECFEKSFNATFVALIPKKMAFIKGRQILDAMVIANELVDSRVKSKQPGIISPAGVIDRIKVLRRTFFWQGNEDKMKYHLVKYEEMNISKKIGGVSIRNMKFQNQSLMMKWLWKFASAVNSLWKEVIAAKYGMSDKWMTTKVPLSQRFPDLYDLCQMQQATVAELWNDQGWNLHFRRNLNDWEMCRITEFLVTLAQFSNLSKEEDSLVWNVGNKGCFTVNSAYEDLNAVGFEEVEWPWKMIWKTKIPYKVNCFTWLLAKETVLTHENLSKRGVHLCSRKKGGEMEDGPIMYMVDSMAREEPEMHEVLILGRVVCGGIVLVVMLLELDFDEIDASICTGYSSHSFGILGALFLCETLLTPPVKSQPVPSSEKGGGQVSIVRR
ncbi:hypothetical protein MTR67_027477 [Solanum verrucosum]|uniref:Reverse transcriptase zinc-binding domain-containing protein n=1 Tax=Solanum verrucosum TaxID=315347 RepID=A0AAF0R0S5_SOLVR|nr:hypothetical protein MTR67_027477 [Solanum verrucosum]